MFSASHAVLWVAQYHVFVEHLPRRLHIGVFVRRLPGLMEAFEEISNASHTPSDAKTTTRGPDVVLVVYGSSVPDGGRIMSCVFTTLITIHRTYRSLVVLGWWNWVVKRAELKW